MLVFVNIFNEWYIYKYKNKTERDYLQIKYYSTLIGNKSAHDVLKGKETCGTKSLDLIYTAETPLNNESKEFARVDINETDTFIIHIVFCLDNSGHHKRGSHYKVYSEKEALDKLKSKLSVQIIDSEIYQKRIRELIHGKQINNIFEAILTVKIIDPSAFALTVRQGIGSRKSYGFGFLMVSKK